MNNNKVSIIIPVYNVESYIDECLNSVVNQTYQNLEIILVDDGSPDKCPQICDNWVEKDNRIKVVHKKNGGLSSARNAGMDVATGSFLMFVDSDDFIEKTWLRICYNHRSKLVLMSYAVKSIDIRKVNMSLWIYFIQIKHLILSPQLNFWKSYF